MFDHPISFVFEHCLIAINLKCDSFTRLFKAENITMMHENIVIISRVKKVLTFAKFQQVAFFCFSLMVLEDSPPQKF